MNAAVIPILPAIDLRRILLATDFSDISAAAVPVVSALAKHYQSQVYVGHVRTPVSDVIIGAAAETVWEPELRAKMAEFLRKPELAGLTTEGFLGRGVPAEELSWFVKDRGIDLAVVTTHGRTGFNRLMMGSIAEELFRTLPCPVLTIGPHLTEQFARTKELKSILFPTDLCDESEAVFPYLAELAAEYRAHLTLLHVLPLETAGNPDLRRLSEPLRRQMEQTFYCQISPKCKAEFVIDSGETTERILAHAHSRNADLIGLGIRSAGAFTKHFRSTVAYRIAMEAECPVLTYRSGLKKW